ncbi:MAG: CotH kinase family protein [Sedimentisphaerales bacterium]|nr:CotH kinase family protein [Sedimentisphaerales bacterium]
MKRSARHLSFKLVIVVLLAGLAGGGVVYFSPNTARRIYKYVIHGRIIAPISIALAAPGENRKSTQLPIFELDIQYRYIDQLNEDLLQNKYAFRNTLKTDTRNSSDQLASYQYYKPAIFRHHGIRYPVEIRYRGDNPDHREGHQKSWRVKLKKHDRFEGCRLFNLINPKSPTAMTIEMGYDLARRLDLLCPKSYFVHKVVNRKYTGVSLFIEQIDKHFLINHRLPEGNLYYGEYQPPYLLADNKRLLQDTYAWDRHEIMVDSDMPPENDPIGRFVQTLAIRDNETFKKVFPEIFDMDYWYNVYAHAVISGYFFRDTFHNHKYYYDPTSGKLRSIIWNISGYGYPEEIREQDFFPPTNVTNLCTGRILEVPEFVEEKNLRLWQILNGPGSLQQQLKSFDRMHELIRPDMYADKYKDAYDNLLRIYTNQQWEDNVKMARNWIVQRDAYLQQALNKSDVRICPDPQFTPSIDFEQKFVIAGYILTNAGECGIVPEFTFSGIEKLPAGQYQLFCDLNDNNRVDKEDMMLAQYVIDKPDDNIEFSVKKAFLPARTRFRSGHKSRWKENLPYELKLHPARYRLLVTAPVPGISIKPLTPNNILALNHVTGKDAPVQIVDRPPDEFTPGVVPFAFGEDKKITSEIIWSGRINLDKNVILSAQTSLTIKAGTNLLIAPNVSILTYGPVHALGSPDNPVIFQPSAPDHPWSVFALQGPGADGSVFRHCHFNGGKDARLKHIFYSGMLNVYNCRVTLHNCTFENAHGDDGVNLKLSKNSLITNCIFRKNNFDALDLDFSDTIVKNCLFEDNGNDGIDLGTASAKLYDNIILRSGDKAISSGENSHPVICNNLIADNKVGLASKDQSNPLVSNCIFKNNSVGVACYQKKIKYGPSTITLRNSILRNNQCPLAADLNSTMSIRFCQLPTTVSIDPLPVEIADNPVARTKMRRPLDWQIMDVKNNYDINTDPKTLYQAGDVVFAQKLLSHVDLASVPIGLFLDRNIGCSQNDLN